MKCVAAFSLVFAFALSLGPAYSACVAPSGVYVGSGAGSFYNGSKRTVSSIQLSLNVPQTAGSKWEFNGWIKQTKMGPRTASFGAPAISNAGSSMNKFDLITCRGVITTEPDPVTRLPYTFSYVVSDDGKQISFIDFSTGTSVVSDIIITLRKV